jgi:rubrerythrin
MSTLKTIDQIVEFAIAQERAAAELYSRLADEARNDANKTMFRECAEEERGHARKLETVRAGAQALDAKAAVADLGIAEHTASPTALEADADYQSVLLFAMHQEKQAFQLYSGLAAQVEDAAARQLLLGLAQEEAKHKLRIEIEYDREVLKEN